MADESLFRIELILKSRHLGDVLAFLTGKAVEVSTPQIVANAERRNGQLRQITKERMVELFALWVKENKLTKTQLHAQDIRNFLGTLGYAQGSYSHYLNLLRDGGVVRKKGEGTASRWHVNEQKLLKIAATAAPRDKEGITHGS